MTDHRNARWFHGGPEPIARIDPSRIGSGNDQYGPGFYVTTDEATAIGYARRHARGYVHEVSIRDFAPAELGRPLARAVIAAVLRKAPNLEETLGNFSDTASEDPERALSVAVGCYAAIDLLAAVNAMANDFFGGGRPPFCDALAEATGRDGIAVRLGSTLHAAIWRAGAVEVIRCTKTGRS